ncbi:Transposase IS66 family protein [Planctomycetes bacterium Pan216]|uniref:Transposase IS66 family protein n=1 Tax=Kolteria novifilia TaxID=2527975 RepID=A0A518AY29_9BACT|nr:Transposase IS66 family protein [Planctomycetes bacterium Pan216]
MTGKSKIPPELAAQMTPEVRAFVESLLLRIAELEETLGPPKNPRNSSLPPGCQHPHAKTPRKAPRSKRKRGGQPGHKKHERSLVPTEECQEVVTLLPKTCRRCDTPLTGEDSDPLRHQVWELPEIKPMITEYRRHRLACPCCGENTCAPLPEGVPTGQSGPRLIALSGLLMACFRQSKRRTALFLESLLGQPCSVGLTVKHQAIITEALRPAYDELATTLPTQPQLGADETPTKQAGQKAWLWTFVASTFTLFTMRGSRAATVLTELLGATFSGVVMCDRAKMYWQLGRLQWCWAHLKRDFQALIDSSDHQVKRLGHDLMRPTKRLFREWARCRDGTITRRTLKRRLAPVRRDIEHLLLRGLFSGNPKLIGMCRELYDHREWLWTFLDQDGVDPTNNLSERSLRHAVIWRKLSFGTQSNAGSRFVETTLTVIETCRQQSRNLFTYLTDAVDAHFRSQPCPSLVTNP